MTVGIIIRLYYVHKRVKSQNMNVLKVESFNSSLILDQNDPSFINASLYHEGPI
jgi:hypothetical protein